MQRLSQCYLHPALNKERIPEKSRLFDKPPAIRLNASRKDSIPFQLSPYINITQ